MASGKATTTDSAGGATVVVGVVVGVVGTTVVGVVGATVVGVVGVVVGVQIANNVMSFATLGV